MKQGDCHVKHDGKKKKIGDTNSNVNNRGRTALSTLITQVIQFVNTKRSACSVNKELN